MSTKQFTLSRTKQCATCPWKVDSDTNNIPNYDASLHEQLRNTIATEIRIKISGVIQNMACHYSTDEDPQYCIGWLYNQLGSGNNIPLRIHFLQCTNASQIEVYGAQHQRFEDTLPKKSKRCKRKK